MAQGKKPQGQQFTVIWESQRRGLALAGASGREIYAYEVLATFHGERGHAHWCTTNAARAAAAIGIERSNFSKLLKALTIKTFPHRDGSRETILARVSGGHNGMTAIYADNLFLAAINDDIAGRPMRVVGGEDGYPKEGEAIPPTDPVGGEDGYPKEGEAIPPTESAGGCLEDGVEGESQPRRVSKRTLKGVESYPPQYTVSSTGERLAAQPNKQGLGTEEEACETGVLVRRGVDVGPDKGAPSDSHESTNAALEQLCNELWGD